MPSLTTNYSFNKPLVNNATDADLWGGYLNDNFDSLDTLLKTSTNQVKRDVTVSGTVTITDRNKIILCDSTAAIITLSLLAAATAGDGFTVTIKKTDASGYAVVLDGNASETIDAATTYSLSAQHDSVILISNGVNWYVAARKITSAAAAGVSSASTTVEGIVFLATSAEAVTGTDSAKAVTAAGVAAALAAYAAASPPSTLPTVSAGASGKIVMGAVTIQWGTGGAASTGINTLFGTPFSGTPYYVGFTLIDNVASSVLPWKARNITSSGFTAFCTGSSSTNWIAIGPT